MNGPSLAFLDCQEIGLPPLPSLSLKAAFLKGPQSLASMLLIKLCPVLRQVHHTHCRSTSGLCVLVFVSFAPAGPLSPRSPPGWISLPSEG